MKLNQLYMQTIVGKLREGLPRIAERGTAEKPQESAVMRTLYRLPDCLARFFAREGEGCEVFLSNGSHSSFVFGWDAFEKPRV